MVDPVKWIELDTLIPVWIDILFIFFLRLRESLEMANNGTVGNYKEISV